MKECKNPVLPGFHPDPAVCRVGDTFYMATSSFQWWPGIPLFSSSDGRQWRQHGHALTTLVHADLRRIGDSYGIWAPDLTFAHGHFWLVYTIVSRYEERVCAETNYLITAPHITGPWSPPVTLHAVGYDPSFFHDEDGRAYCVSMLHDDTPGKDSFGGIIVQEYDREKQRLCGMPECVFPGTELGVTEAPHIYRRNGWYYLLVAEGGTLYGHAVTCARSRSLWGPYEVHPENPILTARDTTGPLQKAGHADMVPVTDDTWLMAYLAARPRDKKCVLGRETCITAVTWGDDDWPRCVTPTPQEELPVFFANTSLSSEDNSHDDHEAPFTDTFDAASLAMCWQTPRVPLGRRADLTSRPGWLRLHPTADTLMHVEPTTLVARRIQHHAFRAEITLAFQPDTHFQHAGLTCYYDALHWYFLSVHRHEGTRCVSLEISDGNARRYERLGLKVLPEEGDVRFSVVCDGNHMSFFCEAPGQANQQIGPACDALMLSDDYVFMKRFAFTGAFVGMAAWDRWNTDCHADIDTFTYIPQQESTA